MTWLNDTDWPLEFEVRVSTDDLSALRFVNELNRRAKTGDLDAGLKAHIKQLRALEDKIHAKLCLGPDA